MYVNTRLLVLLALQVGWACSISWDIVEGGSKRLEFYKNGTLTHKEPIPSATQINSITYDPVNNRLLFGHNEDKNHSISSFDLSTKSIQTLVTSRNQYIYTLSFDPVTQLLFWVENYRVLYSMSLDPASSNKLISEKTLNYSCWDIEVDSCGGFIYWTTDFNIQRARFDGSEQEVLIDSYVYDRGTMAIDQQSQKIYWIEKKDSRLTIKSADFNGNNITTLYVVKNDTHTTSLTVSKDFIYWRGLEENLIWQLPKYPSQSEEAKQFSISNTGFRWSCQTLAGDYSIKDQTENNQHCATLKSLIPKL